MAYEITELVIQKLHLLCRNENFSSLETRIHLPIEKLKEFQKILKDEYQDHETDTYKIRRWKMLFGEIFSLEDFIESLIRRTTMKRCEIIFNEMDLRTKICRVGEEISSLLYSGGYAASVIVGLEDKKQALDNLLLNKDNPHSVVSVLGAAGSGKTTVVRFIYRSVNSKKRFDCRAWISVGQDFEERDILLDLYRQLRKAKKKQSLSVEQLREELELFLTRKRYLIVLDDVRTPDIWNTLQPVFPITDNGSRVILTIRDEASVADHMDRRHEVLPLRPLREDEGWKLFTKKVRTYIDDIPLDLKEKILQMCHGIPLAIVVLGGLLSTKNKGENYSQWSNEIEQTGRRRERNEVITANEMGSSNGRNSVEDQPTSSDEPTSPNGLSWSCTVPETYQHLSFSSKCCLLYLGLFPRSYDIPVRRLLHLWVAEGLVTQPAGETEPLEDLAESCFEEIQRANMILVTERKLDGNPKTCRLVNTVYDTLRLKAEKAGFFDIHSSSGIAHPLQSYTRRLVLHSDMYIHRNPFGSRNRHLRSYISFYKRKDARKSGASKLLRSIIKKCFGMLVVLDLEGVCKPVLPEKLGKLRHLKYLGLRWTLLDSIPESVGDLPLLETLDIKHTGINTLPSTIWVAKKLRNLYAREIDVDASIVKTSAPGTLSNLQILWGLVIREMIDETDWLENLTGLRKLKLTCLEESMRVIAGGLSTLSKLQSLKLRSINESNEPADLALDLVAMRRLTNLSRLYLLGKLPESIRVSEFPENLEVLTLSVSHLSEDPMEAIGKLGKLKVLRLYAYSFKGQNMTCLQGGFPKLEVLKLWMLEELQNWTVEENAMPVLKDLEIRWCKKLKDIDGLQSLTALKELTLTNMEPRLVADVERQIGSQVKITKNDWKFAPQWE